MLRVKVYKMDGTEQVRVGKILWDGKKLVLEPPDSPLLERILKAKIEVGEKIVTAEQPEAWLRALHTRYSSAYLRVSEAKEERSGVELSTDASGHEHKGKGLGGGQFMAKEDESRFEESETYYHGSPDKMSSFAGGTSFTTNKHHAVNFGEHVHHVKLHIKNPVDLNSLGSGADEGDEVVTTDQIRDALAEYGIKIHFPKKRSGFTSALLKPHLPEIIRQAKEKGYDGLLLQDYKDFEADEVVPFDSHQIKLVGHHHRDD